MKQAITALVLAAGKGVRMRSRRPKVLHELCGLSMFEHVLAALRASGVSDVIAIVSAQLEEQIAPLGLRSVVQEPQNGTGHAVQLAIRTSKDLAPQVLIVSADMPLVRGELFNAVVRARQQARAALAMVTARAELPTNFGRILRRDGRIVRIVESADASPAELSIDEVNAGIYCFQTAALKRHLSRLRPNNAQGELYLTDCVAALAAEKSQIVSVESNRQDVMGVNNRAELAAARRSMQRRIALAHMLAGVTIVDPAATYIDVHVGIARDTTILPQTHLLGATRIAGGCVIGPGTSIADSLVSEGAEITYSVIRDSKIGPGVTIGPFANVRRGTVIEAGAHVGNFVELKNTRMGSGAKAGHLSYLGDADLGAKTNIGAGTITCNFDGKRKHKTRIGRSAFIGSNTSLVAPLDIGEGALTGAGSVVLRDVPDGERVAGNPAKSLRKKAPTKGP